MLPFAVGAIAQAKGVQVLMPIVLAMLVADAAVWAFLPGVRRGGWDERVDGTGIVSNEGKQDCTSNDEDKTG